jgi:hypothetical protein
MSEGMSRILTIVACAAFGYIVGRAIERLEHETDEMEREYGDDRRDNSSESGA